MYKDQIIDGMVIKSLLSEKIVVLKQFNSVCQLISI